MADGRLAAGGAIEEGKIEMSATFLNLFFLFLSQVTFEQTRSTGFRQPASPDANQTIVECVSDWTNGFSLPANGAVYALLNINDGTDGNMYVGGAFTSIAGISAKRVAHWNGIEWSTLGEGLNGSVMTFASYASIGAPELYAAGWFTASVNTSLNHVARWDGNSWKALKDGLNGNAYAMAVFDDGSGPALYVAGEFTLAGNMTVNRIAKWDGINWSGVGGGFDDRVSSLTVFNDGSGTQLYAGGKFHRAGNVQADYVARWNGLSWSAVGGGLTQEVYAFAELEENHIPTLFAGGGTSIGGGGISSGFVAKWKNNTWTTIQSGTGTDSIVFSLASYDDGVAPGIFADAVFVQEGMFPTTYFGKWNGQAWWEAPFKATSVFASANWDMNLDRSLLVSGGFSSLGTSAAPQLAVYDSTGLTSLANGFDGPLYALREAAVGNQFVLLAGGNFHRAGSRPSKSLSYWNGQMWSEFAGGVNGTVLTIQEVLNFPQRYVVIGGLFSKAGDVPVQNVARWNQNGWSSLGDPITGPVYAIQWFDGTQNIPGLYVGGSFEFAGTARTNNIAMWNGISSWLPLGLGVTSTGNEASVRALATFPESGLLDLYVGGTFNVAGKTPASNIARWNGASWSAMGTGVNGTVNAIALYNGNSGPYLVVGGEFTRAGTVPTRNVARWDGISWGPLGSGVSGPVYSLTVHSDETGTYLYAGGDIPASFDVDQNLLRWNGEFWLPVGEGVDGPVHALSTAEQGNSLFVGGEFARVGVRPSSNVARWARPANCSTPPLPRAAE